MKKKTFMLNGEEIEVASNIDEEEANRSIEEIEEMYAASEMTESDAADLFGVDISRIDFTDEEMGWLDDLIEEFEEEE